MLSIKDELISLFGEEPAEWGRTSVRDMGNQSANSQGDNTGESNESADSQGDNTDESNKPADTAAAQKQYISSDRGKYYNLALQLNPPKLPDAEAVDAFLNKAESWDIAKLSIQNENLLSSNERSVTLTKGFFPERYEKFARNFESGDTLKLNLEITKNISPSGVCSVYEWAAYAEFLLDDNRAHEVAGALPAYLNGHLKNHPKGVNFLVHDAEVDYATGAASFANNLEKPVPDCDRQELLTKYNDASLYMGRMKNVLLPGDFHAVPDRQKLPEGGEAVLNLMNRYETVYSLLYLASASWFENDELVVQLTKGGMEHHLAIDQISYNPHIYELAMWVFSSENALERAEIVRDVMAFYLRSAEDIISIDEGILQSTRSRYKQFTGKKFDQYIALKRSLNNSIFESTKQIHEMIGSLVGGFEKNFIAVITVILTQILANHITWENLGKGALKAADFRAVMLIYTVASLIYLAATLYSIYMKWSFYSERYSLLRRQYEEFFDEEELNKAFDNDKLIKDASQKLLFFAVVIALIWVVMIACVWILGQMI